MSFALHIHPTATDPAKPPVKIKKEAAKIILAAKEVQGGGVAGMKHNVFLYGVTLAPGRKTCQVIERIIFAAGSTFRTEAASAFPGAERAGQASAMQKIPRFSAFPHDKAHIGINM